MLAKSALFFGVVALLLAGVGLRPIRLLLLIDVVQTQGAARNRQNAYSVRSATAGSIRIARRPGNIQAMRAVDNRSAATVT